MVYEFATSGHRDRRTGLAAANALEFELLDAALLHDLISVGCQIRRATDPPRRVALRKISPIRTR
jgi:hypothetical protein